MSSSRALIDLSDGDVLSNLHKAALAGHRRLKQVLLYLGEVEERRLHLKEAYASMFDFCIRSLGMSDGEAYRRIAAARLVRTFPTMLEWIERGDLNLSTLMLLRPHLTESNLDELVTVTSRKVKLDVQRVLAARFPQPHAPSTSHGLPDAEATTSFEETGTPPLGQGFGFEAMPLSADAPISMSAHARGRVTPLSATQVQVEFTARTELHTNLTRALDLMSHSNPTRELGFVFERALELLVAKLEREKRGKVARPRTSAQSAESTPSPPRRAPAGSAKPPVARSSSVMEISARTPTSMATDARHAPLWSSTIFWRRRKAERTTRPTFAFVVGRTTSGTPSRSLVARTLRSAFAGARTSLDSERPHCRTARARARAMCPARAARTIPATRGIHQRPERAAPTILGAERQRGHSCEQHRWLPRRWCGKCEPHRYDRQRGHALQQRQQQQQQQQQQRESRRRCRRSKPGHHQRTPVPASDEWARPSRLSLIRCAARP